MSADAGSDAGAGADPSIGDVLAPQIDAAVDAIWEGQVIGLPTDTVYGIGVDPTRPDAVRRIFAAKGRSEDTALPLLIAAPEQAEQIGRLSAEARTLIERFWPGPLTLVVPRRASQVSLYLGGDPATVGLRCPGRPVTLQLLRRTGPLAVTSANRHGEPPAVTVQALRSSLGQAVTVVIDGGICNGAPSTVVSLLGAVPVVLREGAIQAAELFGAKESLRGSGVDAPDRPGHPH